MLQEDTLFLNITARERNVTNIGKLLQQQCVVNNCTIRELVDSLCRDGTDTPIVRVHMKAF